VIVPSQSFVDFLEAYGLAHPPQRVYREGEDFPTWQREFREQVRGLLGPVPERVKPALEIIESIDAGDHVRHLLHIPVSEFATLVAYLLVPKGISGPRPGLIASHGHSRHGIDTICGVPHDDDAEGERGAYALHAVRAGYVVLAPAWWGWHGRDGHVGLTCGRDKSNVIQMAASMYGLSVLGLHVQDGQAALDALAARPEVDPARLGCIGNSYGGRTTMWLAILDERIRACVASGCMNTFRERSLKLSSCGIQFPPGILRYGDVPELLSLIAPRPMQLQAGEADGLITPADRDHIAATVRRAYRLLGAEASFDYVLHPGGHFLVWELAATFLAKHLQASPRG